MESQAESDSISSIQQDLSVKKHRFVIKEDHKNMRSNTTGNNQRQVDSGSKICVKDGPQNSDHNNKNSNNSQEIEMKRIDWYKNSAIS
jgi:hypothetical protein